MNPRSRRSYFPISYPWATLFVIASLPLLPARAQLARPDSSPADKTDAKSKPGEVPVATESSTDDSEIKLSPFEVNVSQDRGYQATSAMSGTRLNTKLEDLAASLSV